MSREADVQKLEGIVEDRVLVEEMTSTKAWKDLILPKLDAQVEQWKLRIASDEFINDHNGYIKALTHIQDLTDILALILSYDKAGERAIKTLEQYKEIHNES